MEYNFVTNIESCYYNISPLVYYSHIPTGLVSLLLSSYVFSKNKSLVSRLLLTISIFFLMWLIADLIVWTNTDSRLVMFFWSAMGLLYSLIYFYFFYFIYVFINKRDVPLKFKFSSVLLLLPLIFGLPTIYNIEGFDTINCEAIEGNFYTYYYYGLGFFIFLCILIYGFYKYIREKTEFKPQILFLVIGVEAFLFSFFLTGFLASYLDIQEVTYAFEIEQYGLFSMVIFMAFLSYLIVKYKAFDIKLIGAQALMVAIIILVGSQFFFIRSNTNRILNGITLVFATGAGVMLIRSIKLEVKRKEELQMMTEKLAVSNDRLRQLDNAKSEFVSIASHQLRTPLTAMKGFISLLSEGSYGKVSVEQKEVMNKIFQSNERLINLVEDLLNLSRIESGRMEFKFEKIALEGVCQEIFDTFVLKAKDNKLKFKFVSPPEPLPPVTTDRNKIREVISNLVDNAIKYTPKGGVTIEMKPSENNVQVRISDTGIGIPPDEIPYLFAKFSRGKDTSRLNTGGTGLGLHVGKRMIEELGGKLWVESEGTGKGSTFIIEVPIEHVEREMSK